MSGQGRSLMSSSSSHHRTHAETHRSHSGSSHSHTHSQHSTSHYMSTSTVKHWHSQTNSKGHLVIAKKLEPNQSADKKLERKIRDILGEFNGEASFNQLTRTTGSIIKVVQKYNRGEYNESSQKSTTKVPGMQPSSKAPKTQPSSKVPKAQPPPEQTPVKSALKVTPKHTKVVEPKKVADRLADRQNTKRASVQRIPRELMQLVNSDGFVPKPPMESKRTPKKVTRFGYDRPRRTRASTQTSVYSSAHSSVHSSAHSSKQSKSSGMGIQNRTIEKNRVQPIVRPGPACSKPSSSVSPGTQYQKTATVTESVQKVQRTINPDVNTVATVSAVKRVISQATTVSVPNGVGNFMHNRVKITHYPMIEVKLEPDEPTEELKPSL